MILVSVFSMIGGAALGLCSRAQTFVLRMLAFSIALTAATAVSRGWGPWACAGGFALCCIGAQVGYFVVILARAGVFAHQNSAVALTQDLKRS